MLKRISYKEIWMDICLKQISDKNDNNERKQNTEMFTKLSSTEYIQTGI